MVTYRELQINEIERIHEINRREEIYGHYKLHNGMLVAVEGIEYVNAFDHDELNDILCRQRKIKEEGGLIIGAFDDEKIMGVASVENKRRGMRLEYCKMDILYVSYEYRGRGIGKNLVEMSKRTAQRFGASKLYISATPTKTTVDFYLKLGAILTTELDIALHQKEPEDIHLELKIT
jgi:GNAT superfamily N-acetyltransferase